MLIGLKENSLQRQSVMIENVPNCVTLVIRAGGRGDGSLLAWLSLVPLVGATCEGSSRESFCCGLYSSHFTVRKAPGPTKVQGRFSIAFYRGTGNSQRFIIWEKSWSGLFWYEVVVCGVVWSVLVRQAQAVAGNTTKPPPALRKSHSLGEAFVGSFTVPA